MTTESTTTHLVGSGERPPSILVPITGLLDRPSEQRDPSAENMAAFGEFLCRQLQRLTQEELREKRTELFHARLRLTGKPMLDLSAILGLLGLKQNVLPSPYREAVEMGDSRMVGQFEEKMCAVIGRAVIEHRTLALDELIEELTLLFRRAAMPS
jgi:hypothetical protein